MVDSSTLRTVFKSWLRGLVEVNRQTLDEQRAQTPADTIQALEESFQYALLSQTRSQSSGLVEMQRLFSRLKR